MIGLCLFWYPRSFMCWSSLTYGLQIFYYCYVFSYLPFFFMEKQILINLLIIESTRIPFSFHFRISDIFQDTSYSIYRKTEIYSLVARFFLQFFFIIIYAFYVLYKKQPIYENLYIVLGQLIVINFLSVVFNLYTKTIDIIHSKTPYKHFLITHKLARSVGY